MEKIRQILLARRPDRAPQRSDFTQLSDITLAEMPMLGDSESLVAMRVGSVGLLEIGEAKPGAAGSTVGKTLVRV